jgi:hypothetical protein
MMEEVRAMMARMQEMEAEMVARSEGVERGDPDAESMRVHFGDAAFAMSRVMKVMQDAEHRARMEGGAS